MPKPFYIRTPFLHVDGSTAAHYTLVDNSVQKLTVYVDSANDARLRLQPVFPGKLTFKPLVPAPPPNADPSEEGSYFGNLFLELSPNGQNRLRAEAKHSNYALIFAYMGVTLDPTFFKKVVLDPLRIANGFRTVEEGTTKLTTAQAISNAFARGAVSVDITLDKTENELTAAFPKLTVEAGATAALATFVLGVRPRWNPYDKVSTLADLTNTEHILADADFVRIPVAYFYRMLSHLQRWPIIAANKHASHAFITSILNSESPSGSPSQAMRWRQLRMFVPEMYRDMPVACHAFEGATAIARPASGVGELWTVPLNLMGEHFVRRPDDEQFKLEVRDRFGTKVQVSNPPQLPADELNLTWNTPSPGTEPGAFDILAYLPITADPLALPHIPLRFAAEDKAFLTVMPEGSTVRVIARGEVIKPLQRLLRDDLGFRFVTDTGKFDHQLSGALREFQIYAGMNKIAVVGDSSATRYADKLVAKTNTEPYTGEVHGLFSAATGLTLLKWRQNQFRCPVVIESWTVDNDDRTKPITLMAENIWDRHDNPVQSERVFVRDLTDYYNIPSNRKITMPPPTEPEEHRVLLGRYKRLDEDNVKPGGPQCLRGFATTWSPDTDVTPEHLIGQTIPTNPAPGSADERALSTYKVIHAVSYAEAERSFDGCNGYDNAVMSMGVLNWTVAIGEELGPYLSFLEVHEPEAFRLFFGRFGLRCNEWKKKTSQTTTIFNKALRAWSAPIQQKGLRGNEDWSPLPRNGNECDYLRNWHWFHRWLMASRTSTRVQLRQWDFARLRLSVIKDTKWATTAFANIGQVYTSERMICALLRAHTNRPKLVVQGGQASPHVLKAFTTSGLSTNPDQWSQSDINRLDSNLVDILEAQLPSQSKGSIIKAVNYGITPPDQTYKLSNEKNSFKFDTTKLTEL
jgi:hypothetical protein